jgi:hypothetical protein
MRCENAASSIVRLTVKLFFTGKKKFSCVDIIEKGLKSARFQLPAGSSGGSSIFYGG